jgi:uncharacterized membrane protein YfcA
MSLIDLLLLVIIGIIAGIFTGAFGLGGGLLLVPGLVYFLGLNQQTAQGTSITIMLLPLGLFAFFNYYRAKSVNIQYAMIIAVAFMASSYFGSKLALGIPEPIMKKIFGGVLFMFALKMILNK